MKFVNLFFLIICITAILSKATKKDIDRLLSELKNTPKHKHKKSHADRNLFLPYMMMPHMFHYGHGFNPLMTSMMNPAIYGMMNPYFTGMFNPMGLGSMYPYYMTHINPYYMASMNPYLNMWHNPMTYGGLHGMYGMGPVSGITGRAVSRRYLNDKEGVDSKNDDLKEVNDNENHDNGLTLTTEGKEEGQKTPERILMGFKKRIGAKAFAEEMAKVDKDFGLY